MPKISSNNLSVYNHEKKVKKTFKIEIMYNQDYSFYAKVPAEYHEVFEHMTQAKQKEFNGGYWSKTKYVFRAADKTPIVSAETEGVCLSMMKKLLEYMLTETVVERRVIILFYSGDKGRTQYNNYKANVQHEKIGLEMGLTYAVETSLGDVKTYQLVWECAKPFGERGEKEERREDINLLYGACTVIPDTKENRAALEKLYDMLKVLNENLKMYTKTEEKLLELISGGGLKLLK